MTHQPKTRQEKIELLTKMVVEAIHGKPYEEAVKLERDVYMEGMEATLYNYVRCGVGKDQFREALYYMRSKVTGEELESYEEQHLDSFVVKICTSRIMQALANNTDYIVKTDCVRNCFDIFYEPQYSNAHLRRYVLSFKLLKDNYQPATLEDQEDETIDSLIHIFTNN